MRRRRRRHLRRWDSVIAVAIAAALLLVVTILLSLAGRPQPTAVGGAENHRRRRRTSSAMKDRSVTAPMTARPMLSRRTPPRRARDAGTGMAEYQIGLTVAWFVLVALGGGTLIAALGLPGPWPGVISVGLAMLATPLIVGWRLRCPRR
jgi:hypothetical protein